MRTLAWTLLAFAVLFAVITFITIPAWRECRSEQHSFAYCIQLISN